MPKSMDLDFSEVPDGAHNIYNYDNAAGFHITCEYEHFLRKYRNWSLGIGLKYYKVTYELTSLGSNGYPILAIFAPDEFRNLDGSGFDLTLSAATYF